MLSVKSQPYCSSLKVLCIYITPGVSGKMSTETADEDDNFGTESSQQAIFRALGENRRNRVLAGLYMGRSDTSPMVRQASLHVWKVIVSHTPKTLRQILSTLFSLLLGCLASSCYDKRQVSGVLILCDFFLFLKLSMVLNWSPPIRVQPPCKDHLTGWSLMQGGLFWGTK